MHSNKTHGAFVPEMFKLLEYGLNILFKKKGQHNLDCHLLCFSKKWNTIKKKRIHLLLNQRMKKSSCVFSIICYCCAINGFDKTSQSLSLCSPVETLTLLGAVITASVSTLWVGGGNKDFRKKKNLFPRKSTAEDLEKKSLCVLCCASPSQTITISMLGWKSWISTPRVN